MSATYSLLVDVGLYFVKAPTQVLELPVEALSETRAVLFINGRLACVNEKIVLRGWTANANGSDIRDSYAQEGQ